MLFKRAALKNKQIRYINFWAFIPIYINETDTIWLEWITCKEEYKASVRDWNTVWQRRGKNKR